MVRIDIEYQGALRCSATHAPSGQSLLTDAPVDNQGQGESFSPTDLVATALGTCILTTMAIVAERHGWDLTGTRAHVVKGMVTDPVRRIGSLDVVVSFVRDFEPKVRGTLERAALTCPVHRTLSEGTKMPIHFRWGAE